MNARGIFVTGTDTGVGKTRAAVALIHALRAQGLRVAAMKPVSAGAVPDELNEDVAALRAACNVEVALRDMNPYAFDAPVAPHIAAAAAGVVIDIERIAAAYARLAAASDVVVVEGAGGWRVPLSGACDMADLAARLGLPAILVVGLKLGCLNHAILTAEAIRARGVAWAGWIGNRINPAMAQAEANIATLGSRLPGPCLGILPFMPDADAGAVAHCLTLPEELAS
ncbi:MAG: dethiobiotin synthase [Pseudomonadota bacterium]